MKVWGEDEDKVVGVFFKEKTFFSGQVVRAFAV